MITSTAGSAPYQGTCRSYAKVRQVRARLREPITALSESAPASSGPRLTDEYSPYAFWRERRDGRHRTRTGTASSAVISTFLRAYLPCTILARGTSPPTQYEPPSRDVGNERDRTNRDGAACESGGECHRRILHRRLGRPYVPRCTLAESTSLATLRLPLWRSIAGEVRQSRVG